MKLAGEKIMELEFEKKNKNERVKKWKNILGDVTKTRGKMK